MPGLLLAKEIRSLCTRHSFFKQYSLSFISFQLLFNYTRNMAGQSSCTHATLAPNSSPPRRSARRLEPNAGDTTTSNTSGRQRQEKRRSEAIPQQTARQIPAPTPPQEPIRANIDLTIDSRILVAVQVPPHLKLSPPSIVHPREL